MFFNDEQITIYFFHNLKKKVYIQIKKKGTSYKLKVYATDDETYVRELDFVTEGDDVTKTTQQPQTTPSSGQLAVQVTEVTQDGARFVIFSSDDDVTTYDVMLFEEGSFFPNRRFVSRDSDVTMVSIDALSAGETNDIYFRLKPLKLN